MAQLLARTYSAAEREVIYRLMLGGGQVRRFREDPIPRETLQRILDAALDAPCIGERPPWQLILVTSPALRATTTAAVKEAPEKDASTHFDDHDLEISVSLAHERLEEAPLHLAITHDRSRNGSIGLDRL